jgi:uncharacterized protein
MKRRYTLITISLILGLYIGASFLLFHQLTLVPEPKQETFKNTPKNFILRNERFLALDLKTYQNTPYQELIIRDQSYSLSSWVIGAKNKKLASKETIILVHGLGESKHAGGLLMLSARLYQAGYQVILFDQRNHGFSKKDSGRTSLGKKEAEDIKSIITYLNSKGIEKSKIGLYGVSLGGISSLIAFLKTAELKALVIDAPFINHHRIITAELKRKKVPQWLLPGGLLAGRVFFNSDLLKISIPDLLATKKDGAILLIHGKTDDRITIEESYDLEKQLKTHQRIQYETWFHNYPGHCDAIFYAPKDYEKRVIDFFNRTLIGSE